MTVARAPTVSGPVSHALAVLFALPIAWATAGVEAQAAPVEPEDVAEAQAALEAQLESVAEAASIETELPVAVGLHVASAFLVTGGGIGILFGAMSLSTEGDDAHYERAFVEFVAGLIAVPLGAIAFAIAIGLEVDGGSRRNALRQRLSVSAGPGDLGLSLSLAL